MWIRTKAVLLFSSPLAESDLLVILFTEKLGKVRALAKGALRSKRRFTGTLLDLNRLQVELSSSRRSESGYLLSLAEVEQSRFGLALEPERLAAASVLAELVEKAAPEQAADPRLFALLDAGLDQIQNSPNFRALLFHFLLQILDQLGVMPSFERCAACGKKIPAGPAHQFFSIAKGGFLCESDRRKSENRARQIPAGFGRTLRALQRADAARAGRVRLSQKDFALGLGLFGEFVSWHLNRNLLSLKVLAQFTPKNKGG